MKSIPLKIPVKPHIKAYLEFHYSEEYTLSLNDILGMILFHLLKKQSGIYKNKPSIQKALNNFTDEFEVHISQHNYFHLTINELTPKTIIDFNNLIDRLIDFNFQSSIKCRMDEKPRYKKDAIHDFMEDNGITEESLSSDALIKAEYRFRKKMKSLKLSEF